MATAATTACVGGDGDDFINGGLGQDTLRGGDGDDYLRPGWENGVVDGGAGLDRLSMFLGGAQGVEFDASRTGPGRPIRLDTGLGVVTLLDVEQVAVTGTAYADTLIGGKDADYLQGGAGSDVLNGGRGADFIHDAGDSSTLVGGAGR